VVENNSRKNSGDEQKGADENSKRPFSLGGHREPFGGRNLGDRAPSASGHHSPSGASAEWL